MASVISMLEAPIPKPVLWVGTPIAAIVVTSIFVFLGFPYDQLADTFAARASELSNNQVTIGDLEPRITIAGPGFTAVHVTVTSPRSQTLVLDKVKLRPAWSLSWFRGAPALHIDVGSQLGDAHGNLELGSTPGWDGEFSGVDLALLPLTLPGQAELNGRIDADIDLSMQEEVAVGTVSIEGAEGSVTHPQLPIELEFDTLRGHIVFGGESLAEIESFELNGPILIATAHGRVSRGNRPGNELLDIDVAIEIENPGIRAMLKQQGVRLDASGRTELKIGGTSQNPKIR